MEEVLLINNAGRELLWGNVNKLLGTVNGVQVGWYTVIKIPCWIHVAVREDKYPKKWVWTARTYVVSF
jgi:hypothetical protein